MPPTRFQEHRTNPRAVWEGAGEAGRVQQKFRQFQADASTRDLMVLTSVLARAMSRSYIRWRFSQ